MFCSKCGNKLDDTTCKCHVCDKEPRKKEIRKQKKEEKKKLKKTAKKEKWKKLSFKQKVKKICLKFVLIILVLLLLLSSGTATLVYFDVVDIPAISQMFDLMSISKKRTDDRTENTNNENKYAYFSEDKEKELEALDKEIEKAIADLENKSIDADSYFRNNSNIVSEIKTNDSNTVSTETEVYNNFAARGFQMPHIETEYSMDGTYYSAKSISNTSQEKHPIYQMEYVAENGAYGQYWKLTEL